MKTAAKPTMKRTEWSSAPLRTSRVVPSRSSSSVNVALSAPGPIEPRLESFRTAWNASDRLSLDALYHPTMQTERQSQFFGKALRIWDDELPEVGRPTTEPRPSRRMAAAFPLTDRPNERVLTRWFVSDGDWYLEALTVPAPEK